MQSANTELLPGSDPGNIIADRELRELYARFLRAVRDLHDEVRFETTRMETRAFFGDALLCRVVAYRQLFHVQVGKENVWEIRVRDAAGCCLTLDRVLERFLEVCASLAREGAKEPAPG